MRSSQPAPFAEASAPLSWLTPLQNFKPRSRAGRPLKLSAATQSLLQELSREHTVIHISRTLGLNRDTVSRYLGRRKRGR